MEVNGAVPASAGTVTFTGIGSIALLGSFFIFWFLYEFHLRFGVPIDKDPTVDSFGEEEESGENDSDPKELGRRFRNTTLGEQVEYDLASVKGKDEAEDDPPSGAPERVVHNLGLPNAQTEPRSWLARSVLLGAQYVTAMIVGSSALLGSVFISRISRTGALPVPFGHSLSFQY
jgi:hypothetical protein